MLALTMDARRTIREAGVKVPEYVRSWSADGLWYGDVCGCPDDRCVGHHHDAEDECGCLRSILDERKKNAPDAAATAIEGNESTTKGEIMTIVTDRYPSLSIANYCATLRQKHSEVEPITFLQDPRVELIASIDRGISRSRVAELIEEGTESQQALGEIYFRSFVVPSIPFPLTAPTWSAYARVLAGDWPNVDIEFRSFPIEMGNISAHWEQVVSIAIEDDVAPDGSVPTTPAGTVMDDRAASLIVTTPAAMFEIEMSLDDLDDMGHVLRVAAGGMHLDTTRATR